MSGRLWMLRLILIGSLATLAGPACAQGVVRQNAEAADPRAVFAPIPPGLPFSNPQTAGFPPSVVPAAAWADAGPGPLFAESPAVAPTVANVAPRAPG